MTHNVTLIPGDGTGPELAAATRRVLEATGVEFNWDVQEAGADIAPSHAGNPLPDGVIDSIRRSTVAIKGPITTPVGTGFRSVNVALRKTLDLYACVRPCKTLRGRALALRRHRPRDRPREHRGPVRGHRVRGGHRALRRAHPPRRATCSGARIRADSGISIKPISISGSERIVRFAFEYARKEGRRKVTAVHKANIMKYTDGLFLRIAREVAEQYPDIEFEDRIVDNMCMQLVQKPELYDVLVMPNLYGDILSDLCAGLVGGLGVAPGANFGTEAALFEPTHGSAPRYAGQNKVNPAAMMLSGRADAAPPRRARRRRPPRAGDRGGRSPRARTSPTT